MWLLALAPDSVGQDQRAQAAALFAAGDHAGAVALYEQALAPDDADGESWYRYGYCLHALGRLEEAVPVHARAAADGGAPYAVNAAYNLGCALALLGRVDEAFTALDQALAAGFANVALLGTDGDLASLRGDPRWPDLLRRAAGRPAPTPPEQVAARRREFDFWIGEWDVVTRAPAPDGRWNDFGQLAIRVVPVLDGAALLEFASGTLQGFSLRVFDAERDAWRLLLNWPGNGSAAFSTLEGRFRHGRGEFFSAPWPATRRTRYSFSDITGERLRWDGASSADAGRTWNTNLIFEFTRRAKGAPPLEHGPAWGLATDGATSAYAAPAGQALGPTWGHWSGQRHVSAPDAGSEPTEWSLELDCWAILDGAVWLEEARLERPGEPPRHELLVRGWQTAAGRWEAWRLDDHDLRLERLVGGEAPEGASGCWVRGPEAAGAPAGASDGEALQLGPASAEAWTRRGMGADGQLLWEDSLERRGLARVR